jgi:hypothetical protein
MVSFSKEIDVAREAWNRARGWAIATRIRALNLEQRAQAAALGGGGARGRHAGDRTPCARPARRTHCVRDRQGMRRALYTQRGGAFGIGPKSIGTARAVIVN